VAGLVPAAALAGGGRAAAAPGRASGAAVAGVISTVAGGVGGPARGTSVALGGIYAGPCGVSYGAGRVLVAAELTVRTLNPQTGWLATPAGGSYFGRAGNGGPAARATLDGCGGAVDQHGNLVIADGFNVEIRVVARQDGIFYGRRMTAGDIYPVAGDGTEGFSGDGGPATAAELDNPRGVAVDAAGNLVIANAGGVVTAGAGNGRIRVVAESTGTFYGQAMTAGDIYTIAGGGSGLGDGGPATRADLNLPAGVAVDAAGSVVIADTSHNRVRLVAASTGTFYGQPMTAGDIYTIGGDGAQGFSGDRGPGTAARLHHPEGVAADAAGNVLIADTRNQRVRVVAAGTGTFYGQPMTAGDIYTIAGGGGRGFSGDGGPADAAALDFPRGVAADGSGNVLIADYFNNRVRVAAAGTGRFYGQAMTAGDIYTVAGNGLPESGDGGPATAAVLKDPRDVAADGAGDLLIAGGTSDRVQVVAASTGTLYGRAVRAGHLEDVAGDGTAGFSGDGGPATAAELDVPTGAAPDAAGNLLIADTINQRIRVVAASTGAFYGRPMTAGHIYTIAGNGTQGFSGDGGPATAARLWFPDSATADSAGNVLIADNLNSRIRVVAESTGTFYGQAMTAGHIYTIAGGGTSDPADGGPATAAALESPSDAITDSAGNVLIPDPDEERVWVVAESTGTFYGKGMTAGDIYAIAGDGNQGFSGDGGPGTAAQLDVPTGVAADGAGNVLIADNANNRIRVVAGGTGTFYGQPMTAGDIYTIAGHSPTTMGGFTGDGGPAAAAQLSNPQNVAVDGAGNVLIADTGNGRIREVSG
jgi:hypothetical protein